MPVKARTPKPLRTIVTETMVELYARGVEIIEAGDDEDYEEDGGHRDEFFEIDVELQSLLGRRPWQCTVFDVALDGGPPPHNAKRGGRLCGRASAASRVATGARRAASWSGREGQGEARGRARND